MVFWGVVVDPKKPYKYVVSKDEEVELNTLHLSQATLAVEGSSTQRTLLKCKVGDGPELLLCSLIPNVSECCTLDLMFDQDVTFSVRGPSQVHLTGYMMPSEDDEAEDEDYQIARRLDEEESSDDDDEFEMDDLYDDSDYDELEHVPSSVKIEEIHQEEHLTVTAGPQKLLEYPEDGSKKKADEKTPKKRKKDDKAKPKTTEAKEGKGEPGSDESEDEDGFPKEKSNKKPALGGVDGSAIPAAASEAPTSDSKKKKKKNKKKNKVEENPSPDPETNTEVQPTTPPVTAQQGKKAAEGKVKANGTPKAATNGATPDHKKGGKRAFASVKKFPNGLEVHELAMGKPDAKQATSGKKVGMIYTGRLKSNGKVFDSNVGRGIPFVFRLGVGEVIKGWDIGVNGMRVGDKRKLIIPPAMAYQAKGVPGTIPGNATLEFDIELVSVK